MFIYLYVYTYISRCLRPTPPPRLRLSTIRGNGAKHCQSTPSLAPTNTNITQHHTTPHTEIHKKYSKNMARDHPKTAKNRRKSRPVAPLGDPGALLGAPGAPSGVQGRKSDEKHGSFPPVLGPILEHVSVKKKKCLVKKCAPGACFLRVVVFIELWSEFGWFSTPWNHKTTNSSREWH